MADLPREAHGGGRAVAAAEMPAHVIEILSAGFESPGWLYEMRRLARQIGAQHMGYGYATREGLTMPFCSTLPRDFVERYADRGYRTHDPVPRAIVEATRPVAFGAVARTDAFREIFVDGGGEFGMRPPTLGVPLQGVLGRRAGVAFYGLDLPADEVGRARLFREAERLAREFHQRVTRGTEIL